MSEMTEPTEPPHAGNIEEWLKWAETKVALSLAVSFYFKPPPSSFAEGILECYRHYLELCEPHLRWYGSETSGKYREADSKVLRIPFRRVPEAIEHDKFWAWMTYAGADYRDAAPYQFDVALDPDKDALSFFRAAFPVGMFASDFAGFTALVETFARRVPFFFGYAGLSFSEALEIKRKQSNEQLLLPAAMRFSGVEVESSICTRLCCRDSIKGVNWLTLIDSSLVERLGGRAALRAQLDSAIALRDLPAGLMIQAGQEPELGDVNAGERLPLYRQVHRAMRPVRVVDHWLFGGRFFLQQETRRWMSRFDD